MRGYLIIHPSNTHTLLCVYTHTYIHTYAYTYISSLRIIFTVQLMTLLWIQSLLLLLKMCSVYINLFIRRTLCRKHDRHSSDFCLWGEKNLLDAESCFERKIKGGFFVFFIEGQQLTMQILWEFNTSIKPFLSALCTISWTVCRAFCTLYKRISVSNTELIYDVSANV